MLEITFFFCLGTSLACVFLGATFGALGSIVPESWEEYVELLTSVILVILGLVLIFKPHWLHLEHTHQSDSQSHHHGHDHDHAHEGGHNHDHAHERSHEGEHHEHHEEGEACGEFYCETERFKGRSFKHGVLWGIFSIGFVNMIIPCPTAGVMYTYCLVSKNVVTSMIIFLAYAVTTSIVLFGMTYFLWKASAFLKKLNQEKNETLITRFSGALIAAFGIYMILIEFDAFSFMKVSWAG
jgi:nickel/cobalt exporter